LLKHKKTRNNMIQMIKWIAIKHIHYHSQYQVLYWLFTLTALSFSISSPLLTLYSHSTVILNIKYFTDSLLSVVVGHLCSLDMLCHSQYQVLICPLLLVVDGDLCRDMLCHSQYQVFYLSVVICVGIVQGKAWTCCAILNIKYLSVRCC
jgi:hypothetical protein